MIGQPQRPEPPAPERELPEWVRSLERFAETFDHVQRLVCVWFVRLVWAPCLLWGLAGLLGAPFVSMDEDDVAIRTFAGLVLFLVWLFVVRRGRWSLNRDGTLERR